jgi:23S rRNA (uracil1939-C5)-methyltransferase
VAEIVLDIEHLNTSGDGVARHRGQIITVPVTIPASVCAYRSIARDARRNPARGRACIAASRATRLRALWRLRRLAWQHIAYPEQLRLKTEMVDRLVKRALPKAPAALPMIAATPIEDPWHFRQKAHFVFGPPSPGGVGGPGSRASRGGRSGRGGLIMGHYARGSRRVMAVRECPVHDERGNTVAFGLFDAYSKVSGRNGLPTLKSIAIRVSSSTHETMATLGRDRQLGSTAAERDAAGTLRAVGLPRLFMSMCIRAAMPTSLGRRRGASPAPSGFGTRSAGATFLMSPTAFFQTNVRAAEILVRLVIDAVPADVPVLDLYAGAGLFALPLAKRGQRVTAVEASHAAVEDGKASLRVSRIPPERCRFVAKPVSTFTRALAERRQRAARTSGDSRSAT